MKTPFAHAFDCMQVGRWMLALKRKSPGSPGLFAVWWRRRELNPRPPVLSLELYMFSVSLLI